MKDWDSVDHFMMQVMGIINQLRAQGENIQYEKVVNKVKPCC